MKRFTNLVVSYFPIFIFSAINRPNRKYNGTPNDTIFRRTVCTVHSRILSVVRNAIGNHLEKECNDVAVPQWYANLPKHDTVWVVAGRMRFFLWLETQRKRVADELYVTWRTSLKRLHIRCSRLWRWGDGTLWIGPLYLSCTSPRTCNELGDVSSPPSCCKGSEKPSHDATCSLWCLCWCLYACQRSQWCG